MAPHIIPELDFFASPGNAQLPQFVARDPHWEECSTNSLECSLKEFRQGYANPPWTIIGQWLGRLKTNPHLKCMMINPLLGFSCMVAPTSKNASPWNTGPGDPLLPWNVLRLFWGANASHQVAPSLHSFARKILEAKEMHPEQIDLFLKSCGDISRYDRAFRRFYMFCQLQGVCLDESSVFEVAGLLISYHACNKNEARNAYSGLVLLPEWIK